MAFRKKMRRGKSKRLFSKTAGMTHKKNLMGGIATHVKRGGYRL